MIALSGACLIHIEVDLSLILMSGTFISWFGHINIYNQSPPVDSKRAFVGL